MSRVRIVCKAPVHPDEWVTGSDTEVYLVRNDGTEERIPNVVSVSWTVAVGGLARAHLTLDGPEIDATALLADAETNIVP